MKRSIPPFSKSFYSMLQDDRVDMFSIGVCDVLMMLARHQQFLKGFTRLDVAKKCRCSESSLIRSLRVLEVAGVIRRPKSKTPRFEVEFLLDWQEERVSPVTQTEVRETVSPVTLTDVKSVTRDTEECHGRHSTVSPVTLFEERHIGTGAELNSIEKGREKVRVNSREHPELFLDAEPFMSPEDVVVPEAATHPLTKELHGYVLQQSGSIDMAEYACSTLRTWVDKGLDLQTVKGIISKALKKGIFDVLRFGAYCNPIFEEKLAEAAKRNALPTVPTVKPSQTAPMVPHVAPDYSKDPRSPFFGKTPAEIKQIRFGHNRDQNGKAHP